MPQDNQPNLGELGNANLPAPDFSQISEKPRKKTGQKIILWALKIFLVLAVIIIIVGGIWGAIYYRNFKQAVDLSYSAKDNLELAVHKMVNRDFKGAAVLIKSSHDEFSEAKSLLDDVALVRHVPYLATQFKAVDQLLISGIKLTDSGEKVVLLIDDIMKPLANESITYATITPAQKKDILNKIVASEALLYQVKDDIDEASAAIDAIPADKLVGPLRNGIAPLKEYMPLMKRLIDSAVPMLRVIPKIVGFEEPKTYLFLLQNNSELRGTGGFIGTYGILKLQDAEIKQFDTDNIYNLDRATQTILKEPSPAPIAKYLEQKNWALRDINWAPDFPTTAQKALYMYNKENQIWLDLKASGKKIVGEQNVEITEIIPYEPKIDGVIAMTSEILGSLLNITGPVTADGTLFDENNYQDQLEFIVEKQYLQSDTPISQRKEIIKKLADQIILRLTSMPLQKVIDVMDVAFNSLDQKQVQFYVADPELEALVLERGWGGAIKQTDGDYLMVVDSNMASLKTDQYVKRQIDYSLRRDGDDLIAKVNITYQNDADFTWKSTRLRTYTRVYVPQGSELLNSSGAMENDKTKNPDNLPGTVEVGEEFNKAFFGAFISIEPHEKGVLSYEYKLPARISDLFKQNQYNLAVQKQAGVVPGLTLNLKFDKTIKSAAPAEQESEWFNTSYNYSAALEKDSDFWVQFK